jgi:hypothetical protein
MTLKSVCAAIAAVGVLPFAFAASAGESQPAAKPDIPAEGQATPIRAVIELFTSQGCSSCPPADALLKTYSNDPSVVALSMPVDYWDYLGWKDIYASPRNSDRQRAYAKARGDGAIYTPQVVVNGMVHVNGSQKTDIDNAVEMTSKDVSMQRVPVKFWQERNTLNIATGAANPNLPVREATVWLGVVQTSAKVDIKTGENAGKSLVYTNVVRDLTPIGLWKGEPLMIQIPRGAVMLAETQKAVVLIQEGRAGPIVGAAWAGLW